MPGLGAIAKPFVSAGVLQTVISVNRAERGRGRGRRPAALLALACAIVLATATVARADVYWIEAGKVGVAADDGSGVNRELIVQHSPFETGTPFANPCGLASYGSHLYWIHSTPSGEREIARATVDGGELEPGFIAAKGIGCGIAAGPSGIYWSGDAIGRANLDGSHVNPDFATLPKEGGVRNYPFQLALNASHVFATTGWACDEAGVGAPLPQVTRTRLDGTHTQTGIAAQQESGHEINSIAASGSTLLLAPSLVVCNDKFHTAPPPPTGSAIEALSRSSRTTLLDTGGVANANLAVEGPYLFWSQYGVPGIDRINLDGSDLREGLIDETPPNAVATTQPLAAPSNDYTFGRIFRHRAKAAARVEIVVPGPGTLLLWGPGVAKVRRALPTAGEFRPWLRLKGGAKRSAHRTGRAQVNVQARFIPVGGSGRDRRRVLTLVAPRATRAH